MKRNSENSYSASPSPQAGLSGERLRQIAARIDKIFCSRPPEPVTVGEVSFPTVSGIVYSTNPWCWNEYIKPEAGAMRLVAGLGARFDGADDDYSRLVSLNAPLRRPESGEDEIAECSQRRVDGIGKSGSIEHLYFPDIVEQLGPVAPLLVDSHAPILTFDGLLGRTPLVGRMTDLLDAVRPELPGPFAAEFTLDVSSGRLDGIHPTSCRRLPTVGNDMLNPVIRASDTLLGLSRRTEASRLVYVVPSLYSRLSRSDRYEVARAVGRINAQSAAGSYIIAGPGRWGTSSAELGVPVQFAEIDRAAAVIEVAEMHSNLKPEISFAAHFLNDLVAGDMLYAAVVPGRNGHTLREEDFPAASNTPGAATCDAIRVIDGPWIVLADTERRSFVCGIER